MFQFVQGCLGLDTTFLLSLTSDDVVSLLIDFTTIEFVVLLDNAAFEVARQGFYGASNKLETGITQHTEYAITRQQTPGLQIGILVVMFVLVLVGWAIIYAKQIKGAYPTQSIYVEFDDEMLTGLGAYTGFFSLSIKPWSFDIQHLQYKADKGRDSLGYRRKENAWTFTLDGDGPRDKVVAQSESTPSYDITSVVGSDWYINADMDTGRILLMDSFSMDTGRSEDYHCGSSGRGTCENNRCVCNEGFYGIWCDYERSKTCSKLQVDEETPIFRASRDYSTEYDLLMRSDGSIVEAYNHPVYFEQSGSGLDIMIYTGIRWVITNERTLFPELQSHTQEGLARYSTEEPYFANKLSSLEFFTEQVLFGSPDDGDSPTGAIWYTVR